MEIEERIIKLIKRNKMRLIDLTGKRFNRLTVIERSYPNTKRGCPRWLCKCDCGVEKIVNGIDLRKGKTQSCGCLQKEYAKKRKLEPRISNMRHMISNYRGGARRRGLEWKLTEEQFKELTQQDCFYCGAKPNNRFEYKGSNGAYIYNGIDRVNNDKGYTIENTVPCCFFCNERKRALTLQEFKDWIKRVYIKLWSNQ